MGAWTTDDVTDDEDGEDKDDDDDDDDDDNDLPLIRDQSRPPWVH